MKRALVLKKETLTQLGTDELAAVAGGGTVTEFTCTGMSVTFCTVCTVTTAVSDIPDVATIDSPCGTR
ncbi:MAG TPA: class I lanthipeptide [Frankiaceae bacterium]|nr:class I lanthipeptide [Frankiaceae bacterium]